MTIQNPYFDIVVNTSDKTFYIVDSASSTTRDPGSDRELLRKMEMIMKSKFTYDPDHPDSFSGLSSVQLFTLFQEQAGKIRERCLAAESSWSFLKKQFSSNEKAITDLYQKIMACKPHSSVETAKPMKPEETMPFKELLGMVTDFYTVDDIIALEGTSKENAETRTAAESAIIKRAKEFGYKPRRYTKTDLQGALRHLRAVAKIIKNPAFLHSLVRFSPKLAAYNDKELNVEKTILNLQNLSNGELIAILNTPTLSRSLPEAFFELFVGRTLNASPSDQDAINRAFIVSITQLPPLIYAAKFLLEQGANVRSVTSGGVEYSLLNYCVHRRSPTMIKLLLKHGYSINERGPPGWTPLEIAIRPPRPAEGSPYDSQYDSFRFRTCIQILIENGADLTVKDLSKHTPLQELCMNYDDRFNTKIDDVVWAVELLLKNGADPKTVNKRAVDIDDVRELLRRFGNTD